MDPKSRDTGPSCITTPCSLAGSEEDPCRDDSRSFNDVAWFSRSTLEHPPILAEHTDTIRPPWITLWAQSSRETGGSRPKTQKK